MDVMDTKCVRVVLLHNFLSPYRVPLFGALARRFDLDVWILGDIRSVRDWRADAPDGGFRLTNVSRITIPLGSRYNAILLNVTLPFALARLKPDVILCCGWDTPAAFYAALHARVTRTPFVLWSGSTAAESTLLRRVTRPLVRWLVRSAQAWLAYGSRAKAYLVSLGANGDRTFLAFNTVETDRFAAAAGSADTARLREWLGVGQRRVVLFCGNLLDLKGVGELLEAFAMGCGGAVVGDHARPDLPSIDLRARGLDEDVVLLVVGSGKDEEKYKAFVREAGIASRVIFTGFVAREALPAYYAISDLMVLPSRSEVWGLVINEALACGVPVLATDACGASADLLTHGVNGYVVPSRDIVALAGAMQKHFAHPERLASMREAARASIAPFTIERTADAFVDAVRCALDSRG